ncbi:YggS family pyridoxal phosphate-dependent enzyme [Candidatus Laterigemmans baculatus]|nr:YggS family pyridoxal phosphate-dependent enzyme [Candidatus Laterigemmans baculatus]
MPPQEASPSPETAADRVAENWRRVVDAVGDAAIAAGRDPSSITIVGVSKYVDAATTRLLVAAGCRDLGESRPQSLWSKAAEIREPHLRWHLIGHLQRNKVRRTLPVVTLIHSIDSVRLADAVHAEAEASGRVVRGLVEVNISGDEAKHGFAPEAVLEALEQISRLPHLQIQGLMAMAAERGDLAAAQRNFEDLRLLRDRLAERGLPQNISLGELSMGMSGDFAEAIAAGATIVRIGSRLFEGIDGSR